MGFSYCSNKYRYSGDYYTCTRSEMAHYLEAVVREEERAELQRRRRPRIVRDKTNSMGIYDDVDFVYRFRLTKEGVLDIYARIGLKTYNYLSIML